MFNSPPIGALAQPTEPEAPFYTLVGQFASVADHLDSTLGRARLATDRLGFSYYGQGVEPAHSYVAQFEKELAGGASYTSVLQGILRTIESRADSLRGLVSAIESQLPDLSPVMSGNPKPY